jgi:hypothetical protein
MLLSAVPAMTTVAEQMNHDKTHEHQREEPVLRKPSHSSSVERLIERHLAWAEGRR